MRQTAVDTQALLRQVTELLRAVEVSQRELKDLIPSPDKPVTGANTVLAERLAHISRRKQELHEELTALVNGVFDTPYDQRMREVLSSQAPSITDGVM